MQVSRYAQKYYKMSKLKVRLTFLKSLSVFFISASNFLDSFSLCLVLASLVLMTV